jgi:tRNA (guanine-N7-)-methyltransferase
VLVAGGLLRMATDDVAYAHWMLAHALRTRGLSWLARSCRDWRERPADQIVTRYEEKARSKGRIPYYLSFEKS